MNTKKKRIQFFRRNLNVRFLSLSLFLNETSLHEKKGFGKWRKGKKEEKKIKQEDGQREKESIKRIGKRERWRIEKDDEEKK